MVFLANPTPEGAEVQMSPGDWNRVADALMRNVPLMPLARSIRDAVAASGGSATVRIPMTRAQIAVIEQVMNMA